MSATHTVLQTRVLNASVESVWDAWTDPELMKQWFCPLGMKAKDVVAELRVGGAFRVVMDPMGAQIQRPPGVGDLLVAHGSYQVIEPLTKLVFSWSWEGRDDVSRVTITLTALGDRTELRLLHDRLESDDCRAFHEEGWTQTLENLSQQLNANEAWSGNT